MNSSSNQPVDPAFSRSLVEDEYFQHLLTKHFDAEFKGNLRVEAEKATRDYWNTRLKLGTTALASILSVAGLFGYSTWSKMSQELQTQRSKMRVSLIDLEAKRMGIEKLNSDIHSVAERATQDGQNFQASVKASITDARNVVNGYISHGERLYDSTDKLSTKTFAVLQSSLTQASSDTRKLETVAIKMDSAAQSGEDLRKALEKELIVLRAQGVKLTQQVHEMDDRRKILDEDLTRVEALRQFAATSASEVFALRSHAPYNSVTLGIPDLDAPSKRYNISFTSNGLSPPVSLVVKIVHPDANKCWSGPLPILKVKDPVRIPTLPFLVEMVFLYHTMQAPDFAILNVRYDPAAIHSVGSTTTSARR